MTLPAGPRPGAPAGPAGLLRRADLWAGLGVAALGGLGLWLGGDYPLGRAGRIGPGYAPRLLSWALVVLGAALVLRAPWSGERADLAAAPRPALLVPLAVLAFALLLPTLGLVAAVSACVGVAAFASPANGPRAALVLAAGLSLGAYLLFVRALGLPLPVFGP